MQTTKPQRRRKYFGMTSTELAILAAIGAVGCVVLIVGGWVILRFALAPSSIPVAEGQGVAQPQATYTPYPTYTPYSAVVFPPTYTPYPTHIPLPTYTLIPSPQATNVPIATKTPIPTATRAKLGVIGVIKVDSWLFEITKVVFDPGKDPSRRNVILLGNLTNEGTKTETFASGRYTFVLKDSQGRQYDVDYRGTDVAREKYSAQYAVDINPGAKKYIAVAFDTLASERTFTIVPGSLVASWSGDVTFTLP